MPRARSRRRSAPGRALLLLIVAVLAVTAYAVLWPNIARRAHYPLRFRELVEENASRFGLDEAHVYAVILCESGFRQEAVSPAGAVGLMQIMPETGAWIAGKLGEEFREAALRDPAVNIRYGCWLLSFLSRQYDGDLDTISAAYHAGSGNVQKWLADPARSADGRTISTTPFAATNSYMEKVRHAYEEYEKLLASGR